MPPRPPQTTYVIELVPIGDRFWAAIPATVRLARLLRAAQRSYGLKALRLTVKPKARKRRKTGA